MPAWLPWLGMAIALWAVAIVLIVAVYGSLRRAGREIFVPRD